MSLPAESTDSIPVARDTPLARDVQRTKCCLRSCNDRLDIDLRMPNESMQRVQLCIKALSASVTTTCIDCLQAPSCILSILLSTFMIQQSQVKVQNLKQFLHDNTPEHDPRRTQSITQIEIPNLLVLAIVNRPPTEWE